MRDAEQTRQKILEVSADEIHKNGFTATSLSVILKKCEISNVWCELFDFLSMSAYTDFNCKSVSLVACYNI